MNFASVIFDIPHFIMQMRKTWNFIFSEKHSGLWISHCTFVQQPFLENCICTTSLQEPSGLLYALGSSSPPKENLSRRMFENLSLLCCDDSESLYMHFIFFPCPLIFKYLNQFSTNVWYLCFHSKQRVPTSWIVDCKVVTATQKNYCQIIQVT